MAPKRAAKSSAPPPPPPVASSTETDSRSRSEESEDEEATAMSLTPTSMKNPPALPQKGEESEASDDDDEEEEEEEEEEEPPHVAPSPAIKHQPLPQPRQDEETDASDEEEEEGEYESDEEAPPPKPAVPKQKADDPKPPSSVQTKKQAAHFRRVWSAEDEVRILEALAAHRGEHGTLPQPDALAAALAGSLDNGSFTSKELFGKVKALRNRYNILTRRADVPSKEHDRRVLDLGKSVWGATAIATKANGHALKEFDEMCKVYPYLAEEVNLLDAKHPELFKRSFGMIDDDTARALDMKIKKQRVMQTRVELRRGNLAREVTKTLLQLLE